MHKQTDSTQMETKLRQLKEARPNNRGVALANLCKQLFSPQHRLTATNKVAARHKTKTNKTLQTNATRYRNDNYAKQAKRSVGQAAKEAGQRLVRFILHRPNAYAERPINQVARVLKTRQPVLSGV